MNTIAQLSHTKTIIATVQYWNSVSDVSMHTSARVTPVVADMVEALRVLCRTIVIRDSLNCHYMLLFYFIS